MTIDFPVFRELTTALGFTCLFQGHVQQQPAARLSIMAALLWFTSSYVNAAAAVLVCPLKCCCPPPGRQSGAANEWWHSRVPVMQ
jgi:hypothetical protein